MPKRGLNRAFSLGGRRNLSKGKGRLWKRFGIRRSRTGLISLWRKWKTMWSKYLWIDFRRYSLSNSGNSTRCCKTSSYRNTTPQICRNIIRRSTYLLKGSSNSKLPMLKMRITSQTRDLKASMPLRTLKPKLIWMNKKPGGWVPWLPEAQGNQLAGMPNQQSLSISLLTLMASLGRGL